MELMKKNKLILGAMLCVFFLALNAKQDKIEQAKATLMQAQKELKAAKGKPGESDAKKICEIAENELLRLEGKDCPATIVAQNASKKKSKAKLEKANLSGENLSSSQLAKANFKKANLINVNFSNADVQGADFSGADVGGALWTNANIEGAKFDNVTGISKELSDKLNKESAKKTFADFAVTYASAVEKTPAIKVLKGQGIVVAMDILKNYLDGMSTEEIQKKAISSVNEQRKLDSKIIVNGIVAPSMEIIKKTEQTKKINIKNHLIQMRGDDDEDAFKMRYEKVLKDIATNRSVMTDAMANSGFM